MFNFKIAASLIAVALLVNVLINLNLSSPPEKEAEEVEPTAPKQQRPVQVKKSPIQKIADSFSLPKIFSKTPETSNGEIKRAEVNESNFNTPAAGTTSASNAVGGRRSASISPSKAGTQPITRNYLDESGGLKRTAQSSSTASDKETVAVSGGRTLASSTTSTDAKQAAAVVGATTPTSTSTSNTTSGVTGANPLAFNACSANIASGAFSSAININLSCSTVSQIKYCLAINTGGGCCNPETVGVTYSGQITIGPNGGDYCLSYYGTSTSNGTSSSIYHNSYTINSALPDLQVGQPKLFYQTMQLNGKSFITSQNFGQSGFSIGQVNLKTHDPSALNMTCAEIVTNYVTLPAPAPVSILAALDVSIDSPATQIEVPLRLDQLDYGDNFITSYIENANFMNPLYSCSTSKINLSDFEFYDDGVAFGDPGTNTVREFSGGFSSYGFFEDQTVVYREPAGVSASTQSGQMLEQGLFGIFY